MTASSDGPDPLLRVQSVSRSFGSTRAVAEVSLDVGRGSLLGIAGHNGAGKSTLFRLIRGDLAPDGGEVTLTEPGATVHMVNQELVQPVVLRVDEFAALHARDHGVALRPGWRRAAWREVLGVLDEMFPEHGIAPQVFLEDLSFSRRQMLECACVFLGDTEGGTRLYLMDEPTSALSAEEATTFYAYLRRRAEERDSAFLITTHRLGEMTSHTDGVVVMSDGRITARLERGARREALIGAMGRIESAAEVDEVVADIDGADVREFGPVVATLRQDPDAGPATVDLSGGEVVGLAGLEGHGQAQCLAAIYAAAQRRLRHVARTEQLTVETKAAAAYVSGDRRRRGVLPLWNVRDNLALADLRSMRNRAVVDADRLTALYDGWRDRLDIRGRPEESIVSLSGGNQQKVLLARALATQAPLVVLDDPTRGVDQATKEMMYTLLRTEARAGKCVVWFSTENDELRQCDRVLVFRGGHVVAELSGDEMTEEKVIEHSFDRDGTEDASRSEPEKEVIA